MDVGQGGRSILELMMVVTLVATISAFALPPVHGFLGQVQLRSERQALLQDIRVVRYAAIESRRPAYLCALGATGECLRTRHWKLGWMGFVDVNRNGRYEQEIDRLVLKHAGLAESSRVAVFMHARWQDIKFDGLGVLRRSGHLRVCDPTRAGAGPMKLIRMNTFGRLAVETQALPCE